MAKLPFRRNQYHTPEKPETQKEQIAMLWEYCVNHLPHQLDKVQFEMGIIRWALALLAGLRIVDAIRG